MSDTYASLNTLLEGYGEWLADLRVRIHSTQATSLSWRKHHSD